MLTDHLRGIRIGVERGGFANEAAVKQGIVLRLLQALEWPVYDAEIVAPEFSLEGRQIDFALCHPRQKPKVFIEVKQIGRSKGADRQLFEYAFHAGIPLAVMTDGQEWHFYLPAGQGSYQERRVYKLDILEREVTESAERLKRYLAYEAVCSGDAIKSAQEDYRNIANQRESRRTLPEAWAALVEEPDELLIKLLADKVESLCGYKPRLKVVASFLNEQVSVASVPASTSVRRSRSTRRSSPSGRSGGKRVSQPGFLLNGEWHEAKSAIDAMVQIFEILQRRDSSFCKRFAARPHGRKVRYLARTREELNPERPDLVEDAVKLDSGWWLYARLSNKSKRRIIKMACGVAGLDFGRELRVNFG